MANLHLLLLMLVAGIGIPLMAALNASLGQAIGNPIAAVAFLCAVAFLGSVALLLFQGQASWAGIWDAPKASFGAGLFFVLYIGSITFAAPRIGLGNAVLMVLFGQLLCAAAIDHFGLFNAPRAPVEGMRLLGFALMGVGVFLAAGRSS